jgi:hypothetical protein
VPLGDVSALYDWGERDDPGYRLWKRVADWISGQLTVRPWAAPSLPMLPAEGQPTEIRIVVVPETTITVVYQHDHETGRIDLLYVGP